MSLATFELRGEMWLKSCAIGVTPDGQAAYIREHGALEIIRISKSELLDAACKLHALSETYVPLDSMSRPVTSRIAQLALMAQSASGASRGVTMVRVVAKKRTRPQTNGAAAPKARTRSRPHGGSLPESVSISNLNLTAPGVNNSGLRDFENALRRECG